MSQIYLVRHPACEPDFELPYEEWRPSAEGLRQIEAILQQDWWRTIRHVYSSHENKAVVVAQAAAERYDLAYSTHRELGELVRPLAKLEEYHARVIRAFNRPQDSIDGWEPVAYAQERILRFLLENVARGPLPTAVISHGIVLSALRSELLKQEKVNPEDWQKLPFGSAAVIESTELKLIQDFPPLQKQ